VNDARKTKRELLEELADLRRQLAERDPHNAGPHRPDSADGLLLAGPASYADLFEGVPDGVSVVDPQGRFVYVNRTVVQRSGVPRERLLGTPVVNMVPPSDRDQVMDHFQRALRGKTVGPFEHAYRTADDRTLQLQVAVSPIRAGRDVVGLLTITRDVTRRRLAEAECERAARELTLILDGVAEHVIFQDPSMHIVRANQAAADSSGKTADQLVGARCYEVWHGRDVPCEGCPVKAALETGEPHRAEMTTPDGRRWDVRGRPVYDVDGTLVGAVEVTLDITDRRRAEEALRQSEEDYRLLFEQSVDGIVVVADGKIVRANRAFADIHGWSVEDLVGTPGTDLLHPDERAAAAERIRGVIDRTLERPNARQYRALRADGSIALVEYRSSRILWKGRPAVQSIVRDVTEQVRLQEQLQQAMKMEAVGQLAGGVAHDFNNLMTGILCHAGLLKAEAGACESVRETADLIEGAARRAAQLTSQLLGFARRGKQQDVPVDLVGTVETGVRLLSRSLTPGVSVRTEFRTPRAYVRGDPVQMEQVVLNLAMNARDAMPDGGTVTFAVERREVDQEACEGHAHAEPGTYTVLSVADTGVGIPAEQHGRVFEPFFTTKPLGKGTGMGLAMVYGIVRNHGGWIDVESEPGQGTTFRVFFPAAEAPPEVRTPPAPAGATEAAAPTGRVLVVDDEELVRDVLSRMLDRLGYEAVTVASGEEAVAYYREAGDQVAGVIIDFRMPAMDGRQCFRALKAMDPDVRAILATGGGTDEPMQDLLEEGLAALVKKPFEIDGLDATLRRALGR